MRKILLIAFIIIIILLTVSIIFKMLLDHWMPGVTESGEEIIRTSLDDSFLIEYDTSRMPDVDTGITITELGKSEKMDYFHIHGEYHKSRIITVIDTPQVRCYQIYNQLLYRFENESFLGVDIDEIETIEPNELPEFAQVAKALVNTQDWKWIKACGSFLIRAGDSDMKNTLKRYAADQFTSQELELNIDNKIDKEEMIDFSKMTLNE